MKAFDSLLLYVSDTARSAQFFHQLFEIPVVEQSPNFAMLALPSGVMLGLWALHDVKPAPTSGGGGMEVLVTLASAAEVDAALAQARSQLVPVIQEPVNLDFGYTFVLESPDGHRIRVFHPTE